jgi:hypothetical protein
MHSVRLGADAASRVADGHRDRCMAAVLAESDVAGRTLACALIENARDSRNAYVRHL